jgi:hypothetical protein
MGVLASITSMQSSNSFRVGGDFKSTMSRMAYPRMVHRPQDRGDLAGGVFALTFEGGGRAKGQRVTIGDCFRMIRYSQIGAVHEK